MNVNPSIEFDRDEARTKANIRSVFNSNQIFFKSRGIEDHEDLADIITFKYPLSNKRNHLSKVITLSPGFTVNRYDKTISGYSVNALDYDKIGDVFDGNSSPGKAYLYGMFLNDHVKNLLDPLKAIARELSKIGFWPVIDEKVTDLKEGESHAMSIISGDRVIAFMRDESIENIYFLYVRTKCNVIEKDKTLADTCQSVKNNMVKLDNTLDKAVNAFFENVNEEDNEDDDTEEDADIKAKNKKSDVTKVSRIWDAPFNYYVEHTSSYVCYIDCYHNEHWQKIQVIRNPIDGAIALVMDEQINSSKFITMIDCADLMKYPKEINEMRCTSVGLGYFTPSLFEKEVPVTENQLSKYREKYFTYERPESWDTSTIQMDMKEAIAELDRLLANTDIFSAVALSGKRTINIFVLRSYQIMPVHAFDNMSDEGFLEFHIRTNSTKIYVSTNNLSRIIYLLKNKVEASGEGGFEFEKKIENGKSFLVFNTKMLIKT